MKIETINMLAEFMKRVDLKGTEVSAYLECMRALETEHMKATANEGEPTDEA